MRFGANWSRPASAGDEFLKVAGDFEEEFGGHAGGHANHAGDHARQEAAKMAESDGAIDPPRRARRHVLFGRQIGGQGIEVVTHHLGTDILAGGQPGQAGGVLDIQSMLEALEGLLDAPATVVKIGECCRGIGPGIEQGGHEHAHLASRRQLADQAHSGRLAGALIIDGILMIRGRQRHHGFVLAGAHELGDGRKSRRRITAHAERNASVEQGRHQPGPWITTIQHQQILAPQPVQALEQHLPFADQGTVQDQRIEQLNAGAKQAEQGGLADAALALLVEQGQANLGSVCGQDPQAVPERLRGNALIDQTQQFRIERLEDMGKKAAARLRESAGGNLAAQPGSPAQQGKERIQFNLYGSPDAGEQEGDQTGEGQVALASEMPRVTAGSFEKSGALNEGGEPGKYVDIFVTSYLAYIYQLVTSRIVAQDGWPVMSAMKYAKALSHEDWLMNPMMIL